MHMLIEPIINVMSPLIKQPHARTKYIDSKLIKGQHHRRCGLGQQHVAGNTYYRNNI